MELLAPNVGDAVLSGMGLLDRTDNCRYYDEDIVQAVFIKEQLVGVDFSELVLKQVVFDNCSLVGCNFGRIQCSDVVFKNCDLSNSDFSHGDLLRCRLESTKGVGALFYQAVLAHVTVEDCLLRYGNFDSARLSNTVLKGTDFTESHFTNCIFGRVLLQEVDFTGANFFKTSLKGVDLRDCQTGGIQLSQEAEELRGSIVTSFQAVDFAKLLGLIVK